jgi:hypothetical protein
VKVTLVPEQMVVPEAAILMLTGKLGFTVMVTELEVAGLPVAQVALDVKMQVTTSLFANEAFTYVLLFEPTLLPFTFHWYAGEEPPFTGVAVNVTLLPGQIVVAEAAILILTGRFGFTVIVTGLDVAGLPETQVALDVSIQLMTSLFARDEFVYVVLFVPALFPFSFH